VCEDGHVMWGLNLLYDMFTPNDLADYPLHSVYHELYAKYSNMVKVKVSLCLSTTLRHY